MDNIQLTTTTYHRTDSGKSWKSKPESVKVEKITKTVLRRLISVEETRFFRNLGGSERFTYNYTKYGYIPVRLTSISPDKQTKVVRDFNIINLRYNL